MGFKKWQTFNQQKQSTKSEMQKKNLSGTGLVQVRIRRMPFLCMACHEKKAFNKIIETQNKL